MFGYKVFFLIGARLRAAAPSMHIGAAASIRAYILAMLYMAYDWMICLVTVLYR